MNTKVTELKRRQERIQACVDHSINGIIVANTTEELPKIDTSSVSLTLRAISRFMRTITLDETPSVELAEKLIKEKKNKQAVFMLQDLLKSQKVIAAGFRLGRVFLTGLRSKAGSVEYAHPKNSLTYLSYCKKNGIREAGYYLGLLFNKFKQYDKARVQFELRHKEGCARSTAELILMYQREVCKTSDNRKLQVLNQKIAALRADLNYK
ncbi:TPA: hypothetical protein I7730_20380 [Vibrio vulnificus]|uniref:Uncharacterized protein n=1 Tax=Vibrio vulnificus TaxID=672 RepID=A0A8H9N3L1_VIBVL|nr:hypothetical protein [Vibrio vulnificus]HAS8542149.1 hypothetical protein [Vibrio vulnificus]